MTEREENALRLGLVLGGDPRRHLLEDQALAALVLESKIDVPFSETARIRPESILDLCDEMAAGIEQGLEAVFNDR